MPWANALLATTNKAPEPGLLSVNTQIEQITVMAFVISAITPTIIGTKEVVESHRMSNNELFDQEQPHFIDKKEHFHSIRFEDFSSRYF